jgi:Fe-S oxidoreductase
MCRHICPIGNVTGKERNNARARALSLSMVELGMDLTPDIMDNVYECALCGACTKECVTGWNPVEFTKEIRLEAAMNGLTPDYICKLIDNMQNKGNPYGKTEICGDLKAEIESLPRNADILLFLGTDARYIGCRSAINAIKLLKKANISFTVLADEPDSGYAADTLLGKAEETRQIMLKAAEKLKYKTVVAYDPADAKVFLREYKEWGIEINAAVKTFPSFINELIKEGSLKPVKSGTIFTFQDPSLLARDLAENAEAREILNACGEVKEMLLSGKDTMWAGNLLMNEYMPKVIERTAKARWGNVAYTKADVLVTASPSEYEVLARVKPENIKLLSIEEVVLRACK